MTGRFDFKAALWAAIIAGIVFLIAEMVLVATVGGGSPWGPPRMIAAIAMGREVLPPPPSFNLAVFMVAMVVHFALSIVLGLLLGFIISRWRLGLLAALGAGAVFGIVVYLVNFYGLTAIFPWFAQARTPITIGAHILFGLVLAWVYHALAVRHLARDAVHRSD